MKSALEKWLSTQIPLVQASLQNYRGVEVREMALDPVITDAFPCLTKLKGLGYKLKADRTSPLKIGVILSGGQAPGGHNVIAALLEKCSSLIGFLGGMKGLIENRHKLLTPEYVHNYLNTGGFDMIGSGRTKLEKEEDFEKALITIQTHGLQGLVIIGGDDSNTNAAHLAEYLLKNGLLISVIGVPKTIDGDFRNDAIEMNFGFDTATKVYSEMIGNLLKDLLSQRKYWFFVKVMGRSASHIALECALNTHPNLTLISEEKKSLASLLSEIKEMIERRAHSGKNFGLILIPEGIVENFPEWTQGASLDPHGNVEVSKLEPEKRLIEEIKEILDPKVSFSAISFFLGYEGRAASPTCFDGHLGYALGLLSAELIHDGYTAVVASITHLKRPPSEWGVHAEPLLNMLTVEQRKGKREIVIAKKLVELKGEPFTRFLEKRESWKWDDDYISPGPIQYSGPDILTWRAPEIL